VTKAVASINKSIVRELEGIDARVRAVSAAPPRLMLDDSSLTKLS
jgi:hypothetical protein